MSGAEADAGVVQLARAGRGVQTFGTIVVCGGGCYGSYYVRQLLRARAAGAVRWHRLLVVDRDPACRVASEGASTDAIGAWRREGGVDDDETVAPEGMGGTYGGQPSDGAASAGHDGTVARGAPPRHQHALAAAADQHHSPAPRVVVSPWTDFFDAYLGDAVAHPDRVPHDAIVPSPLMPHLMYEWLQRRAAARWPGRSIAALPLPSAPDVPWHRHAEAGSYVSFAEWMCPINCIEPARCPETRGARDWSVAPTMRSYVAGSAAAAQPIAGAALLECAHRAFGVGMFDTVAVLAADVLVAEAGAVPDARVLVGTVSHCHGAVGVLHLG